MYVITAFLNGNLETNLYMEVPARFRDHNHTNKVCKLLKASEEMVRKNILFSDERA